jgi:hypothetical protein
MTVNPDLVIDNGLAVADVKYKRAEDSWNRGDLYEADAIANEFRTRSACLIDFQSSREHPLSSIPIGDT